MSCRFLRGVRPRSGIYVVNRSKLVTDADVRTWTAACGRQVAEHVAPTYGKPPVKVAFLSKTSHAPPGAWVITVLDDADQAGDLGWHTEDGAGRVFGRVFAGPCLDYGVEVSTTLSHEITETFCDPDVDVWRDSGAGYLVPWEACDPVEGNAYSLDGVQVSDFVTPDWYLAPGGTPKGDQRLHWIDDGSLSAPFQIAAGGYVVRRWPDGHTDQDFGSEVNHRYVAAKASALARTSRRRKSS